jgi:hypothetical protein
LGAEATSRAYIEFKNEEDVSFCDWTNLDWN